MEAAPFAPRVLHREEHRSAPFASDAEPLEESERDEERGRPDPDPRVAGEDSDQRRRDAHDDERPDEHRLPADPVAVVAEDDAPERPRDESDRERPVGAERSRERIERGKENAAEHERGRGSVEEEVVPLDGGADEGRDDDLAQLLRLRHRSDSIGLSAPGAKASGRATPLWLLRRRCARCRRVEPSEGRGEHVPLLPTDRADPERSESGNRWSYAVQPITRS